MEMKQRRMINKTPMCFAFGVNLSSTADQLKRYETESDSTLLIAVSNITEEWIDRMLLPGTAHGYIDVCHLQYVQHTTYVTIFTGIVQIAAMGLVDSPMDHSENLELLARIEHQLRVHPATGNTSAKDLDVFVDDWVPPSAQTSRELWILVLDVVFAPLWLRIRAAELLNVCCDMGDLDSDEIARINSQETHKLRAIVSSTCQALEELDATDTKQAEQLFTWFGFLERVLLATQSDVCAQVFQNSMYAGMLTKMLRLLSTCSTKVFAATTVCLGLFHDHEKKCGRSVLVGEVLRDMKDGREHLSGALLHVINSCGCPCPTERLVHLWNALQLFGDILTDETASALVFVNDFKVLIDLVIRECTDLPQEDVTRLHYMQLLERVLGSKLYLQTQMYRKRELWGLLESLLGAGAQEDSVMPKDVMDKIKQILVKYIDLLD